MKLLKDIFGRIWAAWAALWFVATMLVFLIPFLLFCYFEKDPRKSRRFASMSRAWMAVFLRIIGCPLRKKGLENFKAGENYIVLCNHNSFMDVPVSSPAIPGGNKTIAKVEMSKIPLFGLIYKAGSILVDRKSDVSRRESYTKMKEVLDMGLHMCIYPEGTRNKTREPLKSFHNGAFRLAIDTQKKIIPSLIFHTRKVLPTDKTFYAIPHRLEIHFLEPVSVLPGDDAEILKERVFRLMWEYYRRRETGDDKRQTTNDKQ